MGEIPRLKPCEFRGNLIETILSQANKGGIIYRCRNKRQAEQTATPDKYPQGYFKSKSCRKCGELFTPKAPSHLYCSQECADEALNDAYLRRNYGLELKDYRRMRDEQQGRCAICGGEGFLMGKKHKMKLVVDHDHKTGAVRGLLCHNCNRALGLFHDDVNVFTNAIQYLKAQRLSREGVGSSDPKRTAPLN